jgi:hypothetical protein
MSSSKHLWSGDWERDSETPPTEPLGSAPVTPPSPEEPPRDDGGARRRRLTALGALVALLIIVGVVLAVVLPGSSSNSNQRTSAQLANPAGTGGNPLLQQTTPQQTTPQQSTTPQQAAQPTPQATAPARIGPTYAWLGMQISETPLGITVATVSIGGVADTAGVNPGDVITAVNSTAVGSIAQLRAAVGKLSVGASFQLTVSRGSTPVTISATLANRPKRQS